MLLPHFGGDVNDIDIIIETSYKESIVTLLKSKYRHTRNSFGGYKFYVPSSKYATVSVDVDFIDKDISVLYKNFVEYNFDVLFYNVKKKEIITFDNHFSNYFEKEIIERIGNKVHPVLGYEKSKRRKKAADHQLFGVYLNLGYNKPNPEKILIDSYAFGSSIDENNNKWYLNHQVEAYNEIMQTLEKYVK